MTARIVPFPSVARPHEVARIVENMAGASHEEAQRRLVKHMTAIIRQHQRAQVSEADTRRDLTALEAVVWHRATALGHQRGGAA